MKPHLLFNPGSGGYARGIIQGAVAELAISGINPSVTAVRNPAEVDSCIRNMYHREDRPFIIIAAGDGTINAVLNGIVPGTATIAILPMGTSNVLAAEIGITGMADGIAKIAVGLTKTLSTGVLESGAIRRRFSLMAGAGVDGAVVRDVGPTAKRLLKQGAYLLSFLRQCLAWNAETFTVSIPGRELKCHTVIACNASRYAGDFILAPVSSPFSEGLTMVCVTEGSRMAYLKAALSLVAGRPRRDPLLLKVVTDSVEISGNRPIQADGDFLGYGPTRITTEGAVAQIIV